MAPIDLQTHSAPTITPLKPLFGFTTFILCHFYTKAIFLYHSLQNDALNSLYYI